MPTGVSTHSCVAHDLPESSCDNIGGMTRTRTLPVIFFLVLAAVVYAGTTAFLAKADSKPIEVRWLLAHTPESLYVDAVDVFARTLEEESGGEMKLHVLKPEDVGFPEEGDVPYSKAKELMEKGEIEVSSTYAVANGFDDERFWVLNLPFLFRDYGSSFAVLDGQIGEAILEEFSARTELRALAYTLSGGFRILASEDTIQTPDDLKGKRVATSGGPVAEATLESFGAIPVSTNLESGAQIDESSIDAVETTYSRISSILGKDSPFLSHIAETNHSLFLTTIVVSDTFFDSLSPQHQAALVKAARAAADVERAASIELTDKTRAELQNDDRVAVFSEADTVSLVKKSQGVYAAFEKTFGVRMQELRDAAGAQ